MKSGGHGAGDGGAAPAVDGDADLGPRSETGLGGRLQIGEIVLDDVVPDELAGEADLEMGVALGDEPPGPDPGVEGLGRQLPLQGREKALPEAIVHKTAPVARPLKARSYTHSYPQVWITRGRSGEPS
jgi:hypothetical protein